MSQWDPSRVVESDDVGDVVRAVALAPPRLPPQFRAVASSRVGTVLLGKYRLDAVLGVGGMAVVYKATHRNGAERAIKMLHPEHSANEDIRRRFRREGRFANSVQHPGAVAVIDDDVSDDGTAFLVLELLHGVACNDLAERLGGRLSVEAACAVALQVLDVLQAAHDKGIIHRDIKPANLFVLRDGSVKVLDFGIARVRQTMLQGGAITETGAGLGTPAFMAPEQGFGDGTSIDERADLWAVGATLFTFLTGVAVTRPTHRWPSERGPIPLAVTDVVDRALQFDPAHRWESARAMRSALLEAAQQCFDMAPGQTLLASLLVSEGWPTEPGRPPKEKGDAELPARPVPATMQSRRPATPSKPSALPMGWIAGAAGLLVAGWFASRPWLGHSVSPVPQPVHPSVPTAPEGDYPEPIVAPAPVPSKPAAATSSGVVPRSCAEARAAGTSSDGPVKIDPDGPGPLHPFEVFCAGMSSGSEPGGEREYITLAHGEATGEAAANATNYVWSGGACDCPDLTRHFARVRLNPGTMTIDPNDGTFARYDRPLLCEAQHRSQCGERMDLAWGSPGSCRRAGDASGTASIDLRGTPFVLAAGVRFVPSGFGAAGNAVVSRDRKRVTLTGGGQCGRMVSDESAIAVNLER